jgi:H+-transporting ATPase
MVLTEPGLGGIIAAVKIGRMTFQRVQSYTFNSVIKKIVSVLFLIAGLMLTRQAILTPMLMVIVMITGDFLGMALTTDHVVPSPSPNTWLIGRLTMAAAVLSLFLLCFNCGVLAFGQFKMGLGIDALRSLAFITLVFGGQATIYAVRSLRDVWGARPSLWLAISSVAGLVIAATLSIWGISMAPLPIPDVAWTLIASIVFAIFLAFVKVPVVRYLMPVNVSSQSSPVRKIENGQSDVKKFKTKWSDGLPAALFLGLAMTAVSGPNAL